MTRRATQTSGERRRSRRRAKRSLLMTLGLLAGVTIVIAVSRSFRGPHEYEVHVVDTGKGIDRDFLPRVFTRFQQADRIGRRNDGLGLGLAICRDLIEQHHGRINVDSCGPGQGTTVVVSLPIDTAGQAINSPSTMGEPSS